MKIAFWNWLVEHGLAENWQESPHNLDGKTKVSLVACPFKPTSWQTWNEVYAVAGAVVKILERPRM